jgi:hypothetical protein
VNGCRPPHGGPWTADCKVAVLGLAIAGEHHEVMSTKALMQMDFVQKLTEGLRREVSGADDAQAQRWCTIALHRWASGQGNFAPATRAAARRALISEYQPVGGQRSTGGVSCVPSVSSVRSAGTRAVAPPPPRPRQRLTVLPSVSGQKRGAQ